MNPPIVPLPRAPWFAAILLALVASLTAAGAPAAIWRVGVARENITPPAGLWMTGYAVRDRPAEGKAQDLWVKALAFADPAGRRSVLLTLDLCAISRQVSDTAAREICRRYDLPRSAVMTNVSHTHCSPSIDGALVAIRLLPPDGTAKSITYTRELEQKMIRAAAAALDSLAPALVAWGEDQAFFGFNRRENAEKDVPARRAAGTLKGPFDPRVPVLAVRSPAGELRAVLISYACHNTTLSFYQWHGDYAGCAMAELERRHPTATVLFAIGCGADINPGPRRELSHAEQHGRELADAADRALQKTMTPLAGRLATAFTDITLTFSRQPAEEKLREAEEKDQPNKEMYRAWAAAVREQMRTRGADLLKYDYPIQAWRLGDLSWVALGGEVVVDYALRLRRELGDNLFVFGYSTDVMAYIPSERVLKEGRYEGDTSMVPYGRPGPWTPGLEAKIVARTHELLAGVGAR